ncbi:hypothetical protein SCG7086_AI_00180 [Chlamydiales bacterium SCGC AG-110-P3]|nr:hypothetical protein SCG7086_AI_00180 [Chlamydiales bacterium SCGC AG-110-P3]
MMELQQNTDEWLEFRRKKIGSSDAPIIMGKSPWKTPHQLWEEKTGVGTKDVSYESKAMQRGKFLEPEARKKFEEETGLVVWPDVLIHPEHDFMIASLDGITMDGKTAVEIKCPGAKTHQMAVDGEVPEHYRIQMQHQMMVVGVETMYYFSFDGTQGVILEIRRDQEMIDSLVTCETAFYKCMTEFNSPSPPREDIEWQQRANHWREIQLQKKRVTDEEKLCRQNLIQLAKGKSSYGSGLRVTKVLGKGRVIYDNVPELKSVDLEQYRSPPRESWRFSSDDSK